MVGIGTGDRTHSSQPTDFYFEPRSAIQATTSGAARSAPPWSLAACAGTLYWANIGRLVYDMEERRLLRLTGKHAENPTLDLPCREVFAGEQKAVRVWGPVAEVEPVIAALHVRIRRC
ncbi:MAG: hypothetical protein WA210_16815 [Burkholderiaceae bacterium]